MGHHYKGRAMTSAHKNRITRDFLEGSRGADPDKGSFCRRSRQKLPHDALIREGVRDCSAVARSNEPRGLV